MLSMYPVKDMILSFLERLRPSSSSSGRDAESPALEDWDISARSLFCDRDE
jgi:hypothetical protein